MALRQRQCKAEHRPAAGSILRHNLAAVKGDNAAADCQANSAAGTAVAIDTVKLLKDLLFLAGWYACTTISNLNHQVMVHALGGEVDGRVGRRELHGIIEEINQHLLDKQSVDGQR